MQLLVYRVYKKGQSTQPWAALVLGGTVEDVMEPSLMACDLLVRKL